MAKNIKAGRVAGCRDRTGNDIYIRGKRYTARKLAWFYIHGEMPRNNMFVKNGAPHDDRISNLGILPYKPGTLTHEYLKHCIDYNPEMGEFKWKITQGNNVYGNDAFCVNVGENNKIQLKTCILCKDYMTTRLIVFWMTGYMPSLSRVVFPIDNNVMNLKWSNIKVGSRSECFIKKRNTGELGSKGVHFDKSHNKYRAQININHKQKHIGYYPTESEAHEAYMKAARKHYGELANDGYQHAMYEMEYEAVERETVAEELVESMEQAVDIAEGKIEPAVVHDVDF